MSCDPSIISGLVLRLKGDDAATGTITTWSDSSGAGHDATAVGSPNKPTGVANVLNGHKIVRFDVASSEYFTFGSYDPSGYTAGEIFIVVKVTVDPPTVDTASGLYHFSADTTPEAYPYIDGVVYDGFGSTARKTTGDPTPSLASWRLYNVRSAASDWQSYIDGTSFFSTGTNTVGFPSAPFFGRDAGVFYLSGDVAEIIFYNRALTSTERGNVNSYIADTYALTIANTVPCGAITAFQGQGFQ